MDQGFVLLDWGDSSSAQIALGRNSLAQQGGDPIKDETIQSSGESLTHLLESRNNYEEKQRGNFGENVKQQLQLSQIMPTLKAG